MDNKKVSILHTQTGSLIIERKNWHEKKWLDKHEIGGYKSDRFRCRLSRQSLFSK